jgi:hypothetical protein
MFAETCRAGCAVRGSLEAAIRRGAKLHILEQQAA